MQLTLFLKAGLAAAAGHGDFSLSAGDPKLLTAVGTAEIAVLFIFEDVSAQPQPLENRSGFFHKFSVFLAPLCQITGEHTKQGEQQQKLTQQREQTRIHDGGQEKEDQIGTDQEQVQLVIAIAAIHKTLQCVADHKKPP